MVLCNCANIENDGLHKIKSPDLRVHGDTNNDVNNYQNIHNDYNNPFLNSPPKKKL